MRIGWCYFWFSVFIFFNWFLMSSFRFLAFWYTNPTFFRENNFLEKKCNDNFERRKTFAYFVDFVSSSPEINRLLVFVQHSFLPLIRPCICLTIIALHKFGSIMRIMSNLYDPKSFKMFTIGKCFSILPYSTRVLQWHFIIESKLAWLT